MAIDYNQFSGEGKFVYLPRIGEEATFKIKELRIVEGGDERFHFKQRTKTQLPDGTEATVEKNLGYHVEAELEDGRILSVNSLGAFLQVFKKHKIRDGEEVRIKHLDRGEWEVERIAGKSEEEESL